MKGRMLTRTGTLGFAWLVALGSHGASAQDLLYRWQGAQSGDALGADVDGAGDVDGDGFADLLVGASGASGSRGYVNLYSGKTGALLQTFAGTDAGETLAKVAGMGDLNGDGLDDFLIGAPGAWGPSGTDYGRVNVCYGPGTQVQYSLLGELTGDSFGASMMPAGDVDHDGVADFIVGSPHYPYFPPSQKGRVYVYSGIVGTVLYTFTGEAAADFFGIDVDGAGDVNADGYDDLLVGAVLNSVEGRAYVYSGKDGSLLRSHTGNPGDALGSGLAGLGDIDRDGYADYLLVSNAPNALGSVTLYSGMDGTPIYSIVGAEEADTFGNHASVGDINGDGFPDFLASAPQDQLNGKNSGSAFLYSGRTGKLLCSFAGESKNNYFGIALSGAGDVNADGLPDFMIGAFGGLGRAYVYAGNDLFLQASNVAPAPTETLSLYTRGGDPGEEVALFLVEANGVRITPVLDRDDRRALFHEATLPMPLSSGVFDSQGQWTYSIPITFGLSGMTLGFQAFSRRVTDSGRASAGTANAQGVGPNKRTWKPMDTSIVRVQVQ